MNDEIRACRCTDFWAYHHPDCPAMQTIRRLRAELAEWQALHVEQSTQILDLTNELAEYKQDAERYRWLRGTVPESSSRWARWRLECWISGAWHELRGLHLDTCIDAARKGEGEP